MFFDVIIYITQLIIKITKLKNNIIFLLVKVKEIINSLIMIILEK